MVERFEIEADEYQTWIKEYTVIKLGKVRLGYYSISFLGAVTRNRFSIWTVR